MMKYALWVALAGVSLGTTGCGCLDTVFYGKQSCAPHWTGHCGGSADACGDTCGDACCDDGYCHQCPLVEVLSALHPDNLLCLHEYRERDACGSCGYGCGGKYFGDWYAGERAGCESCDCHGNWAGPSRSYAHRRGHVMHGEMVEGEVVEGEPTPARPAPPRRNGSGGATDDAPPARPNVRPGPQDDMMPMGQTRGRTRSTKAVAAKVTRSKKPVALRPVDAESEWAPRRGY